MFELLVYTCQGNCRPEISCHGKIAKPPKGLCLEIDRHVGVHVGAQWLNAFFFSFSNKFSSSICFVPVYMATSRNVVDAIVYGILCVETFAKTCAPLAISCSKRILFLIAFLVTWSADVLIHDGTYSISCMNFLFTNKQSCALAVSSSP